MTIQWSQLCLPCLKNKAPSRTPSPDADASNASDATIAFNQQIWNFRPNCLNRATQEARLSLGTGKFTSKSKDALLLPHCGTLGGTSRPVESGRYENTRTNAKLRAIVEAQFPPPRICNRRKLAVWFALLWRNNDIGRLIGKSFLVKWIWTTDDSQCNGCSIVDEGVRRCRPYEVLGTLEGLFTDCG